MRRAQPQRDETVVRFGDVEIDFGSRIVRKAGEKVALSAKEYDILRYLAQHRGRVVTHRQLLREFWGPSAENRTHYLWVYMTHLRQKLEATPHAPRHLRTESGIGYRLDLGD
jgi:two-component system KDP operon response regulator KdpE